MQVQLVGGKVLLVGDKVAVDPACCCSACPCTANSATVEFLSYVNMGDPGSCNCAADWVGSWELAALTDGSCCYSLTEGLPCGATSMVLCPAKATLVITFPQGTITISFNNGGNCPVGPATGVQSTSGLIPCQFTYLVMGYANQFTVTYNAA